MKVYKEIACFVRHIKEHQNDAEGKAYKGAMDDFVAFYMPNDEEFSTVVNLNGSNDNMLVFNGKYKDKEFTVVVKPSLIYDFYLGIFSNIPYSDDTTLIYILNKYEQALRAS